MYNPKVCDRRMANLADVIRKNIDPAFDFTEYSLSEIDDRTEKLAELYDPVSETLKMPLTVEDEAFIRHEINRSKVDFRYWAARYAYLKSKDMALIRFVPTAVQELLLQRISQAELDSVSGRTGDGILFSVLKARQLGISTISEIIIAHRALFYGHTTALIAADVDERTQNLYEMLVRVYDNLPWWMQAKSADPKADYRVKNKQLYWHDQDSVIRFGESSNMQGGDSGSDKGSMGTGQTLPLVHLSELALWQNPGQIDDALMPSIPMSSRTFAIFESTAKGRNNWWHDGWMDAKRGLGRRRPVFIPWYTDPNTYKLPAPANWSPSQESLDHAVRVKATSAPWVGKSVILTKDQLYWYERTRSEYESKKAMHKFLAEYAADDMEAFQNSTLGVFPTGLLNDMRNRANETPVLIEIKPRIKNETYLDG